MTDKQKQHLLGYLGYYTGAVDGIWGPLSRQAAEAFQRDYRLTVSGDLGDTDVRRIREAIATGEMPPGETDSSGFWEEIQYFTREEFRCKCGGKYCSGFPAEPKEQLVKIADELRQRLGVPILVISGLRCPKWNALQGGVAKSQHMCGEAADVYARGISRARVEAELDKIGGVRYHYPIANSGNVHFDIPKGGG